MLPTEYQRCQMFQMAFSSIHLCGLKTLFFVKIYFLHSIYFDYFIDSIKQPMFWDIYGLSITNDIVCRNHIFFGMHIANKYVRFSTISVVITKLKENMKENQEKTRVFCYRQNRLMPSSFYLI